MLLAYGLSLLFTLTFGYAAARNRSAERILMPLLDILQSVAILSFLPVVLLSLTASISRLWYPSFPCCFHMRFAVSCSGDHCAG